MQPGITFQVNTGERISLSDLDKLEREDRPCHFDAQEVEEAIKRYVGERLSSKTAKVQKLYTAAELKARLVRIAFQVTSADLQSAFEKLKAGCPPAILSQLTEEERGSLASASSFDALTDEQLNLLMQPYRRLSREKSVAACLFTRGIASESDSLFGQLELLKSFEKISAEENASKIAFLEYLTRLLPAHFSKNLTNEHLKGALFPIMNESGNLQLFQLQESLREGTLALDILIPITTGQWMQSSHPGSQGSYPVVVLCRDTAPPAGAATQQEWQKRLRLFEKSKTKITAMLENLVQGKECTVTIAGNRLGAVYAQSLLGALAEAQNEGWMLLNTNQLVDQSPLRSIRAAKLLAWDPEPVSLDLQAAYAQNCHAIQRGNVLFQATHDYVFFDRTLRGSSKGSLLGDPDSNAKIYHLELQSRDIGWVKEKAPADKIPLAGERARLSIRTLENAETRTIFSQRFGCLGTPWASSTSTIRSLWPLKI